MGQATNGVAKVVCMPDSGFFLDEDHAPRYGSNMRNVYKFQESSAAGLNAGCIAAHKSDPEKCILAQWTSEYIKTPTFPLQSVYDAWQTSNVLERGADAQTTNEFGKNVTGLVESLLLTQPQHGIFLDSCHHHCGAWNGPVIDGMNSGRALSEWYTHGSSALPNKGFFKQAKAFPCKACCTGSGGDEALYV